MVDLNLCVSIVDKGSAHEWLPSEFQIEIYRGKFKTRISKELHLIMHVKGQSTKQVHELCVFVNLNVRWQFTHVFPSGLAQSKQYSVAEFDPPLDSQGKQNITSLILIFVTFF